MLLEPVDIQVSPNYFRQNLSSDVVFDESALKIMISLRFPQHYFAFGCLYVAYKIDHQIPSHSRILFGFFVQEVLKMFDPASVSTDLGFERFLSRFRNGKLRIDLEESNSAVSLFGFNDAPDVLNPCVQLSSFLLADASLARICLPFLWIIVALESPGDIERLICMAEMTLTATQLFWVLFFSGTQYLGIWNICGGIGCNLLSESE